MPGCELHPGEKVVAQCGICGKSICVVCTKLYGYFCSDKCKAKAKSRAPVDVEGQQMAVFGSRLMRIMRVFTLVVVPIVALTVGIYVIYKVNSKEGLIVWSFRPEKDRPFNGLFLHGDTLVASCDNVCLYGIDKNTGQALWGFDGQRGIAHTRPAVVGDLCLVGDYKNLYGVRLSDGKPAWQLPWPEDQRPELVIGEKYVAYLYQTLRMMTRDEVAKTVGPILSTKVPDASAICVIQADNGAVLWSKELKKGFFAGGELAIGQETIYYGTHTTEEDIEEKNKKADPVEKPVADKPEKPDDDVVHEAEELTTKYTVYAYEAQSERGKWKAVLEGGSGYGIGIAPMPNGVLVTTSSNVYALAEEDGRLMWKRPIAKVGYMFWGPKVINDLVFMPENNALVCLDLKSGHELWRYQTQDDDDPSEPELVGDVVFLTVYLQEERKTGVESGGIHPYRAPGTEDLVAEVNQAAQPTVVSVGSLLALDAKTGRPKWQLRDVGSKLIYGNNQLITLRYHILGPTTETRVSAINPNTGEKLWESQYIGNIFDGHTDGKLFYMLANSGIERFMMSSPQPPSDNVVGAYSIGR